jgi:capsular exopolysaccharide synthesis family protein
MIGLAYSFARESFKLPIHTSWQLSEMTALPVAASIPALPGALAKRHSLMIKEPSFKPIESFRFMAFSLLAQEQRPNVILFSAVGDMVDSSIAAAEFAVAMSKTGSKTILVDADLRASRLSRVFGLEGRSGVADILGRTILPGESSDLFVSTEHDNLTILPAGTMSSSGMADVLTSHLQAMIGDLRDKGDTVVVHCPPVDVFADCSRLAQYVDHCYMVVSAKSTSYRSIPVAQEILEKSGAKFVGIVLTQASQTEEPFGNSAAYRSRN